MSIIFLAACNTPMPRQLSGAHLMADAASPDVRTANAIPADVLPAHPVILAPTLKTLPPALLTETYNIEVRDVPVRDILFVLAQDAKLNLDIHPGVGGEITLNAVNQNLAQLLNRISRQVHARFELKGDNLAVMLDTPYLRYYPVDYLNLSRHVSGAVATNTQIATGFNSENQAGSPLGSGNISSTRVENVSRNVFWESLEQNLRDILQEEGGDGIEDAFSEETAKGAGQGKNRNAARRLQKPSSAMAHPESGIVTVRATQSQHERVQEFLDRVIHAAQRQVMIEATIVEVELSEGYQQGIEWSHIWASGGKFLSLSPPLSANGGDIAPPFVLNFSRTADPLNITLSLLQSFGRAKVLSSPRLAVLNNQTALLKVVENVVYFSIKADVAAGNANANPVVAYTTMPQTVSVGLVMTVTPQISQDDAIILNVRPTISSISGMVKDPNPDIPSHLSNEIPQIRTREIESVLRLSSGEIAVLGGLMEDRDHYQTGRIPFFGQLPVIGELLTSRGNSAKKSELVIFLRPLVIRYPGINRDLTALKPFLPDEGFFTPPTGSQPFSPMNVREE